MRQCATLLVVAPQVGGLRLRGGLFGARHGRLGSAHTLGRVQMALPTVEETGANERAVVGACLLDGAAVRVAQQTCGKTSPTSGGLAARRHPRR